MHVFSITFEGIVSNTWSLFVVVHLLCVRPAFAVDLLCVRPAFDVRSSCVRPAFFVRLSCVVVRYFGHHVGV